MAVLPRTKVALRRHLLARRRTLDASDVEAAGVAVVDWIVKAPWFEAARTIGIYAAVHGEVPLAQLLPKAEGRTFAFPRVDASSRRLSFRALEVGTALELGPLQIPTPPLIGSREVPLDTIDLILVPGVAFDHDGMRLGQGGGYYDATLPSTTALRVGVAHEWQVVELLPREAHDVPVHYLVTPSGVLRVPGKAAN